MGQKIFVLCAYCVLAVVFAEEKIVSDGTIAEAPAQTEVPALLQNGNGVEEAILVFIRKAKLAANPDSIRDDELEKLYEDMVVALDAIIDLMKEPSNIYKFIEAKGMERVILPYLKVYYVELRSQLLALTKLLFDTAPTTTTVMAPVTLLDKLLEIFEEDSNLALKARVIDILYIWLPDNPKMQARVMKQKGLEPFYNQVHKLDGSVVHTLLSLFNKILKEHLQARNETLQKTRSELIKANIYKSIGLIERLGTRSICMGFLSVYQSMWSFSLRNRQFMVPIFDLMKNVQPYCEDFYKGKMKALDLFQDLLSQIKVDGPARAFYENLGMNVTEVEVVLKRYADKAEMVKDEL